MSKHSVTIRGLRVVTTCWSWAWTNRTSPSKWVGLGSPLEACSVYGDLTCSVHTVNNLWMFNSQWYFYLCNRGLALVSNMLSSWNKVVIIIIIKYFSLIRLSIRCPFMLFCILHKTISSLLYLAQKVQLKCENVHSHCDYRKLHVHFT